MSLGKAPKLEYPEPYFQQHDSCVAYGDQMSNSPQGSSGSIGHIDNNLNADFGPETINPGDLADEVAKKRANRLVRPPHQYFYRTICFSTKIESLPGNAEEKRKSILRFDFLSLTWFERV